MFNKQQLAFCTFAAKSLLKQLNRLVKQVEGAKIAKDPECIHQMRVASRHLRSSLPIFKECFPQNHKKWRKEIKKITKELGTARDLDVQIIFLEDFIKKMNQHQDTRGISRLILRQKQARQKQQKKVNKAIDIFQSSGIVDEITQISRQIIGQSKLKKLPSRYVINLPAIVDLINTHLADILSYEDFIYDPGSDIQLHNLRKACKRLRYTLELFEPLYQSKLKDPIKKMKHFQTLLGDIHDCDVWRDFLPVFLENEKERTIQYFGHKRPFSRIRRGVEFLRHNREDYRKQKYQEFINEWEKAKQENFWTQLETIFSSEKAVISDVTQIEKKAGKQLHKIKQRET